MVCLLVGVPFVLSLLRDLNKSNSSASCVWVWRWKGTCGWTVIVQCCCVHRSCLWSEVFWRWLMKTFTNLQACSIFLLPFGLQAALSESVYGLTVGWTTRFRFRAEQKFDCMPLLCPDWPLSHRASCLWAASLQAKQLPLGGDHSPPSNANVKNVWCFTSTFMACHLGTRKTILWRGRGEGGVNLVWQECDRMAEEPVFIFHETLSAKFIHIIVNRQVFGHTLSCSLQSKVLCDFYVTELKL